jgi:hypothetical protein
MSLSWDIYNYNQDARKADEEAMQVSNILANFMGKYDATDTNAVKFEHIQVVNQPYYWGTSASGSTINRAIYRSFAQNYDAKTVYDQTSPLTY